MKKPLIEYKTKRCIAIKNRAIRFASSHKLLSHIKKGTFFVQIDNSKNPGKDYAEMRFISYFYKDLIEAMLGRKVPPYALTIYSQNYNKADREKRDKIIIHELFHINKTHVGVIPHVGFGDEQIEKMYRQIISKR